MIDATLGATQHVLGHALGREDVNGDHRGRLDGLALILVIKAGSLRGRGREGDRLDQREERGAASLSSSYSERLVLLMVRMAGLAGNYVRLWVITREVQAGKSGKL